MTEFSLISYQPLAEAFRAVLPVETRHGELAVEGALKLAQEGAEAAMQTSANYWWPRVAASFGSGASNKAEALREMGLRRSTNAELKTRWEVEAATLLESLGLTRP